MKELVFIHGRSQEKKDSVALKAQWVAAWTAGLSKSSLKIPIAEKDIHFPYYGQTLYDLVKGVSEDQAAEIVIRGTRGGNAQQQFVNAVIFEIAEQLNIPPEKIAEAAGEPVVKRGLLNAKWVQGILRLIDQRVHGGSGAAVALFTNDVYQYLMNRNIGDDIDNGVRKAISPNASTVVVGHSLGTVVAYRLLSKEGVKEQWSVPLFVTLGSPLAVTAIHDALQPVRHPACVSKWYNAMDTRDVVPLYPLDKDHFDVNPPIENNTDVRNGTSNRHGIEGYLSDEKVARRIYDAVL